MPGADHLCLSPCSDSPTEDPRWAPFFDFQKWLIKTFPVIFEHEKTTVDYVNTLGIVTTIQGSDPDLKPLLLYVLLPDPSILSPRLTFHLSCSSQHEPLRCHSYVPLASRVMCEAAEDLYD